MCKRLNPFGIHFIEPVYELNHALQIGPYGFPLGGVYLQPRKAGKFIDQRIGNFHNTNLGECRIEPC